MLPGTWVEDVVADVRASQAQFQGFDDRVALGLARGIAVHEQLDQADGLLAGHDVTR